MSRIASCGFSVIRNRIWVTALPCFLVSGVRMMFEVLFTSVTAGLMILRRLPAGTTTVSSTYSYCAATGSMRSVEPATSTDSSVARYCGGT